MGVRRCYQGPCWNVWWTDVMKSAKAWLREYDWGMALQVIYRAPPRKKEISVKVIINSHFFHVHDCYILNHEIFVCWFIALNEFFGSTYQPSFQGKTHEKVKKTIFTFTFFMIICSTNIIFQTLGPHFAPPPLSCTKRRFIHLPSLKKHKLST